MNMSKSLNDLNKGDTYFYCCTRENELRLFLIRTLKHDKTDYGAVWVHGHLNLPKSDTTSAFHNEGDLIRFYTTDIVKMKQYLATLNCNVIDALNTLYNYENIKSIS